MTAYYNEIDPYAAQWLHNLMVAGHIAPGIIDTRSIEDVRPDELAGFTQCHFFAGIGGWSLALRLAAWPDSRPVWTGSCPCQPFSAAGKGVGFADERHLWPAWQHLIAQCRPAVIFGEQVASKAADPWIDLVHADLEGMGYAFGGIAFPSAGIGAPHIRDRTYWVGDADVSIAEQLARERTRPDEAEGARALGQFNRPGTPVRMAHPESLRLQGQPLREAGRGSTLGASDIKCLGGMADAQQHHRGPQAAPAHHGQPQAIGPADRAGGRGVLLGSMADAKDFGREGELLRARPGMQANGITQDGIAGGLADANGNGRATHASAGFHDSEHHTQSCGGVSGLANAHSLTGGQGCAIDAGRSDRGHAQSRAGLGRGGVPHSGRPGPVNGQWRDADWLRCTDGRWRPVEPKPQPLVDGSAESLGRVRPEVIAKIEEEIDAQAMESQIRRVEVLRALQDALTAEAKSCWATGGLPQLHEAPFLLAFLRQLQEQGWQIEKGRALPREEVEAGSVRVLRDGQEAAGTPRQRGLDGQHPGELADAVHFLSSLLARHVASAWADAYRAYAPIGFPLAHGASSRVGRLRAYGNAINPHQAAEFILAYAETRNLMLP